MFRNRSLALLALPFLLLACTAALPPQPAPPQSPPVDAAALRLRLATLPGGSVGEEPAPVLRYPGTVLFADGAALPLPGGTPLLDPLAELLVALPSVRWTGIVRAGTGASPEGDQALAVKRAELLTRYFARRGVVGERLQLTPRGGPGAPLELIPQLPAAPSAAAAEKALDPTMRSIPMKEGQR